MKKLFAILLACLMVFSLVACGNSGDNGDKGGSGDKGGILDGLTGAKLSDKHVNESQKMEMFLEEGETVTPNGELPNNEEDVKGVDQRYYFNEAINAVIKLDEEQMKLYLSEEECADILRIKEDKDAYALWQHTVGNMTYLPSASAWYGRPTHLVYALWYQDQIKANAKLPENPSLLSYKELVEIYNEYYDKVPVVVEYCGGPDEFYMEDGYIKFELGSPMLSMGVSDFDELMEEDMWFPEDDGETIYTNDLYELVLSWTAGGEDWGNFEAIREDGEYVLLDALLALDLDAAETIMDAAENPWESEWDSEDYNKYVKTPAAKEVFKQYLKDSVQVYRTHDEVYMLFKVNTDVDFGDYDYDFTNEATDAERALLKSATYYNMEDAMSNENLGKQFRYTFGEILDYAIESRVFADVEFPEE